MRARSVLVVLAVLILALPGYAKKPKKPSEMFAEKEAVSGPIALPKPKISRRPPKAKMAKDEEKRSQMAAREARFYEEMEEKARHREDRNVR